MIGDTGYGKIITNEINLLGLTLREDKCKTQIRFINRSFSSASCVNKELFSQWQCYHGLKRNMAYCDVHCKNRKCYGRVTIIFQF